MVIIKSKLFLLLLQDPGLDDCTSLLHANGRRIDDGIDLPHVDMKNFTQQFIKTAFGSLLDSADADPLNAAWSHTFAEDKKSQRRLRLGARVKKRTGRPPEVLSG